MALKPLLLSALWTTTSALAHDARSLFTLSDDFTQFFPPCATDCFQQFLDDNFSTDTCGTSPSLQCLCASEGTSGFTIGEGVFACIAAEKQAGVCTSSSGDEKVMSSAYLMCNGQPSAVAPSHATIVATLVLPKQTAPNTSSRPLPSTLVTATGMPTLPSPSPPRTTASVTLPKITPEPTQDAPSEEPRNQPKLNTGQIIGISLGSAAVVALVIAVFLVTRCARQKRLANADARSSKLRDSWPYGRNSDGSPQMPQISNPTFLERKTMDFTRPVENAPASLPRSSVQRASVQRASVQRASVQRTSMQRNSVQPNYIGLAISQDQQTLRLVSPQQSREDGLVQMVGPVQAVAKPALTLAIPKEQSSTRMPLSGRDSVVTEFAEDGEAEPNPGSAQIWRPPSVHPGSATTYYVADKWNNWVLGDPRRMSQVAELDGAEIKAAANGNRGGASTTQSQSNATKQANGPSPKSKESAQLGPPIEFRSESTSRSRSSSVYSNFSMPQTVVPDASNPMPKPLFVGEPTQAPAQESSIPKVNIVKPQNKTLQGVDRSDSRDSAKSNATTIESSAADDDDYQKISDPVNLSPVMESPLSPGVSPVSYPKIPRRHQNNLNIFPPSTRDNTMYSPPGQPSPTLGLVFPARNSTYTPYVPPATKYGRTLTPNPNPNRNPAQVRTGSPNTPQEEQTKQDGARPRQSAYSSSGPYDQEQLPPARPQQQAQTRPESPASQRSAGSSLLAKRLGADRAAALSLGKEEERSKWKRHKSLRGGEEDHATPSTPRGTNSYYSGGTGGDDDIPLPATPGWHPKLTPTRHGDDLFLRVR